MFELTAQHTHLAEEFRKKPYGHHSPELEAALDRIRVTNPDGKLLAVCIRPGKQWVVAHLQGEPPRAVLHTEEIFTSREDVEWAVFRLRWKSITLCDPVS